MMRHPLVRERIREELEDLFGQLKLTAYRVMRQRTLAAFFRSARAVRRLRQVAAAQRPGPGSDGGADLQLRHPPDGKVTTRVRSPNCQQALTTLEKRYAQFTDLSRWDTVRDEAGAALDEDVEMVIGEEAARAAAEPAAPEPVPEPVLAAAPEPAPTLTQRTVRVVTRLMTGKAAPLAPERNRWAR